MPLLSNSSKPRPPGTACNSTNHYLEKRALLHGNDAFLDAESKSELEAKRLLAQRAALSVADRATKILNTQQQLNSDVLDLRPYADEINDFLLTEISHQLRANKATSYKLLVLSGCFRLTCTGLRSLVHAVGKTLRQLDCSYTRLSIPMLQVLATGMERLDEVNFSSCPQLSSEGVRAFISCCNTSLTSLNLSRCGALTDDVLGWVTGSLGPQGSQTRCRRLLSLDLSYTKNVCDRGLAALGAGCRALQFLDLEGLDQISDGGVSLIVQGCKSLRVLSLKRCHQLSNVTLGHIGKYGVQLRTLNLSGCYGMSSAGLLAMARGTPLLQSLNLNGCLRMREDILAPLATLCPALQVLSLTGCQEITDTGIDTLAENMPFVQRASSYRGLEPCVDKVLIKYSIQEQTIRSSAALRLQAYYRGHVGRCVVSTRKTMVQISACLKIWRCYTRWLLRREHSLRATRTKLLHRSAVKIQSLLRGVLGRANFAHFKVEIQQRANVATSAVKVQAAFRGFHTRKNIVLVRKYLERHRPEQSLDLRENTTNDLHSNIRARIGRFHVEKWMTLHRRRRMKQYDAAVKLQRLYRAYSIRRGYYQLLLVIAKQHEDKCRLDRIAVMIQSSWRGYRSRRYDLRQARARAQAREVLQHASASRINAGARGYFGRKAARSERFRAKTQYRAACVIQRAWRKSSQPSSIQVGLNDIIMQLRKCALNEEVAAQAQKNKILREARDMTNRDTGSKIESDDDWYEYEDEYGDQFWFSPSRNKRINVRPNIHAREKSVLEMPCRVFWPLEQRWFDGRITCYNWKKDRHRVDYDDADHEWLSILRADSSRVQLYNGLCWCMASVLIPTKRALRAAIFIGLPFREFDPRHISWRGGTIQAYNEPSDMFLLKYNLVDCGDSSLLQSEQEWVDVFTTEKNFQVQDAITDQWYSLSGYVFGHKRGRPINLQMLQSAQSEDYRYSVAYYMEYNEDRPVC